MTVTRKVKTVIDGSSVIEGAGVHLKRYFGHNDVPDFDPFLLFDDFSSDRPEHYLKGFPWHPHRGIETITYVIKGTVEHGDSLGNKGVIGPGDIQWMTAGSGIIHQEMPAGDVNGAMYGFQLWANLPAVEKMTPPAYRELKSDEIPELSLDNGVSVKVVAGEFAGISGPLQDIAIRPQYLDVSVPPGIEFTLPVRNGATVIAYLYEGEGDFNGDSGEPLRLYKKGNMLHFSDGDSVRVVSETNPVRFLLITGDPLGEPVAWRGPIVMNTDEELDKAFQEYRDGTFIK